MESRLLVINLIGVNLFCVHLLFWLSFTHFVGFCKVKVGHLLKSSKLWLISTHSTLLKV